jgi:paraquat-inducible protein A
MNDAGSITAPPSGARRPEATLVVCHECDLLQKAVPLQPGGVARCDRCGAILYRSSPDSLARTLAFTLAAAVFFVVANAYPIMGIEMQGTPSETNLYGAVRSLWDQGMHLISVLVGITTLVLPAAELGMMLYLLIPLRSGRIPPGLALFMRILQNIRPWSMVEVFMLGVLVSLVKLTSSSTVIPGVALLSFGGLTFMLAAMASTFNSRDIWAYLEIATAGEDGA